MKKCSKCLKLKKINDFHLAKSEPTGRYAYCKPCTSLREREPYRCYYNYLRHSRQRDIAFTLSFQNFMEYWQKPCYYCGAQISAIGLDRVNSSRGYVPGNIKACCKGCNYAKSIMSKLEFIQMCRNVLKRHG